MEHKVDIIIPVYNAFEDLKLCLNSIYKNTDLEKNRLILINDNSTDESIKPYLDSLSSEKDNIIVIHNESNRGFSANINIGIGQSSENDVILLNSDTVVTANWVEKIVKCAYSSLEIGTVTPLSNNATLCSVPKFCEENKLPNQMTIEEAAQIVEWCSFKEYPQITVAHGFCMFIKREVIDIIGGFDAETFGRGYGEENDFCNRAEQVGYKHVMCDDTYIYHSGTKSFLSKEKEEYIRQHDAILNKRYVKQMHKNAVHVRDNPNKKIGENIGIFFELYNQKKNLLYLVQSDFKQGASDNIGGTQLHVHDLVYGLKKDYNIFVVARDNKNLIVTAYVNNQVKELAFNIADQNDFFIFNDRKQNIFWQNILKAFRIDIIHIHHTYGMSFDVFDVAKELRIPIIVTLHDFYYICPTIKMLDEKGCVCVDHNTETKCVDCLMKQFDYTEQVDFIKVWRKKCGQYLMQAERIVVPSNSAKSIVLKYYPLVVSKLLVIEHGYKEIKNIDLQHSVSSTNIRSCVERCERRDNGYKISGWAYEINGDCRKNSIWLKISNDLGETSMVPTSVVYRPDVSADLLISNCGFEAYIPQHIISNVTKIMVDVLIETPNKRIKSESVEIGLSIETKRRSPKLRVAFIGGLNQAKGGDKVAEIIKKGPDDIDWFVFGGIGCEQLNNMKQSNLIKTGYYKTSHLAGLLEAYKIDVICILSLWPETYSYTLTESILNRIPVIVTDIGALGERTKRNNYGWTVKVESVTDEVLNILKHILENPVALENQKKNIQEVKIKSLEEMNNEYKSIYYLLEEDNVRRLPYDIKYIYEGFLRAKGKITGELSEENCAVYKEYESAFNELNHMKGTIGYKIMITIQKMRFPFKTQIEKLLKR